MKIINHKTSPETVKALRKYLGLTQQQAADSVHTSRRVWQRYETPTHKSSYARIPNVTLDLFCTKHGIKYPPPNSPRYKEASIIGFWSDSKFIHEDHLIINLAYLLTQDNFDVLIASYNDYSEYLHQFAIWGNKKIPRSVYIDSEVGLYEQQDLDLAAWSYDFILLEVKEESGKEELPFLNTDMIITPIKPSYSHVRDRLENLRLITNRVKRYIKEEHNKTANYPAKQTIFAALIVDILDARISNPYFGKHSWYIPQHLQDELYEEFLNDQEWENSTFEQIFKDFPKDVVLMDSYLSQSFSTMGVTSNNNAMMTTVEEHPYSLATFELKAIKEEILRLLRVPKPRHSN